LALAALLAAAFVAGPWLHTLTDSGYADSRSWLGIPNFLNVASNIGFLAIGLAGLVLCARPRRPWPSASWRTFYLGLVLTCLGSAWFHLAPSDARIVWDRLGMVVAFTGLLAALLEQSVGGLERRVLAPALLAGIASVLWWRASGDLRPYAWVQAAPLACSGLAVLCNWVAAPLRRALALSFVLYVVAKITELYDARIFAFTDSLVSGHTLKHLLAALSVLPILLAQYRHPGMGAPPRAPT
jgi:hypothetical protein